MNNNNLLQEAIRKKFIHFEQLMRLNSTRLIDYFIWFENFIVNEIPSPMFDSETHSIVRLIEEACSLLSFIYRTYEYNEPYKKFLNFTDEEVKEIGEFSNNLLNRLINHVSNIIGHERYAELSAQIFNENKKFNVLEEAENEI